MNKERLAAKVAARNRLNAWIVANLDKYLAAVKPFLGTKIYLKTGGFASKFSAAMPARINTGDFQAMIEPSRGLYGFNLYVRACGYLPSGGCEYAEETLRLGDLEAETIFSKACDNHDLSYYRTDYTVEEVESLNRNIEKAKSVVSDLESALHRIMW